MTSSASSLAASSGRFASMYASAASRRFLASLANTLRTSSSDSSRAVLPDTSSLVTAVRAIRNVAVRTWSRSRIDVCRSARRVDFSCAMPGSVILAVWHCRPKGFARMGSNEPVEKSTAHRRPKRSGRRRCAVLFSTGSLDPILANPFGRQCQTANMTEPGIAQLKSTLRADLHTSMRERDQVRTATLRMALTAVTNEEVSGKTARELSDDEVLNVLAKEAKKRREAAEAYIEAKRPELAAKEEAELVILEAYLPAQLSDEELQALVAQAITETGATGMPQMGLVMKAATALVAGRAEGGRVAAIVKASLAAR